MNLSSATLPPEADEIALAGLTPVSSTLVKAPRIAEAPVQLECKYLRTTLIPGWDQADGYKVIFGEVIGVHIDDAMINGEGLVDVAKMMPIGRLGYNDYARVDADSSFTMVRPDHIRRYASRVSPDRAGRGQPIFLFAHHTAQS